MSFLSLSYLTGLILLIMSNYAHAKFEIELDLERKSIKPTTLNTFVAPDNTLSDWTSFTETETYTSSYSGSLRFLLDAETLISYGLYLRVLPPISKIQSAKYSVTALDTTLKTTMNGWLLGPVARIKTSIFTDFSVGACGMIGVGKLYLNQSTRDVTQTSSLSTSALTTEIAFEANFNYNINSDLQIGLIGGFSRQRSNAVTVDSKSGSVYSGLSTGNRLKISGNDFKIDLSGLYAGLGVSYSF